VGNNVEKALSCYDFCQGKSSDNSLIARALANKAVLLSKHNRNEEAVECFSKALLHGRGTFEPNEAADILVGKGQVLDRTDEMDTMECYQVAMSIYKSTENNEQLANVLQLVANHMLRSKEFKAAEKCVSDALEM
jgi:tetratricopeptide (TPR) repeat protein